MDSLLAGKAHSRPSLSAARELEEARDDVEADERVGRLCLKSHPCDPGRHRGMDGRERGGVDAHLPVLC